MFGFIKKLFGGGNNLREKINEGAVIIDVRTASEFGGGHIKGSKNIPLDKVGNSIKKIQQWDKPVIACCASGMRSASAASILRKNGIEAYNGGSWRNVSRMV